jgi:hypothetical protein
VAVNSKNQCLSAVAIRDFHMVDHRSNRGHEKYATSGFCIIFVENLEAVLNYVTEADE